MRYRGVREVKDGPNESFAASTVAVHSGFFDKTDGGCVTIFFCVKPDFRVGRGRRRRLDAVITVRCLSRRTSVPT